MAKNNTNHQKKKASGTRKIVVQMTNQNKSRIQYQQAQYEEKYREKVKELEEQRLKKLQMEIEEAQAELQKKQGEKRRKSVEEEEKMRRSREEQERLKREEQTDRLLQEAGEQELRRQEELQQEKNNTRKRGHSPSEEEESQTYGGRHKIMRREEEYEEKNEYDEDEEYDDDAVRRYFDTRATLDNTLLQPPTQRGVHVKRESPSTRDYIKIESPAIETSLKRDSDQRSKESIPPTNNTTKAQQNEVRIKSEPATPRIPPPSQEEFGFYFDYEGDRTFQADPPLLQNTQGSIFNTDGGVEGDEYGTSLTFQIPGLKQEQQLLQTSNETPQPISPLPRQDIRSLSVLSTRIQSRSPSVVIEDRDPIPTPPPPARTATRADSRSRSRTQRGHPSLEGRRSYSPRKNFTPKLSPRSRPHPPPSSDLSSNPQASSRTTASYQSRKLYEIKIWPERDTNHVNRSLGIRGIALYGVVPIDGGHRRPFCHIASIDWWQIECFREQDLDNIAMLRYIGCSMLGCEDGGIFDHVSCRAQLDSNRKIICPALANRWETYFFLPGNQERSSTSWYPVHVQDVLRLPREKDCNLDGLDPYSTPFSKLEKKEFESESKTWTEVQRGCTIGTKIKVPSSLNISSQVVNILTKRDHSTCRWTDLPVPNVCHVIPAKREKEYPRLCERRFSGGVITATGGRNVIEDIDDAKNMVLFNDSIQALWDANEICFIPIPNIAFTSNGLPRRYSETHDNQKQFHLQQNVERCRVYPVVFEINRRLRDNYLRVLCGSSGSNSDGNIVSGTAKSGKRNPKHLLEPREHEESWPRESKWTYRNGCVFGNKMATEGFARWTWRWHMG